MLAGKAWKICFVYLTGFRFFCLSVFLHLSPFLGFFFSYFMEFEERICDLGKDLGVFLYWFLK